MRYRYILLDLDNTLYDTRQTEQKAMSAFLDHYAPEAEKSKLFSNYRELNENLWQALESGKLEIKKFNQERFRRFFAQESILADPAEAGNYYLALLCKYHLFYPEAEEIYEYLTKKYKVALITNGLRVAQKQRIKQTFLKREISPLYIGEVIGHHKPAAGVVDHIMVKENWMERDKIIIIGDSLRSDILCAVNSGISSIWCNFTGEDPGVYQPDYTVHNLLEIKNIL